MTRTHELPKVAILGSTYGTINQKVRELLELLDYRPAKENIFIKPNLTSTFSPRTGIITSPRIIEALIMYLRDRYPERKIVVGDGCATGASFEDVFRISGYGYLVKKYGIEVVDLDGVDRSDVRWKYGTLRLPELLGTHEYINVAKMKTNATTVATLAMKNQKGLLERKMKRSFHVKMDLHDAIRKLCAVVRPDLNIIDGMPALEGNGPTVMGTSKRMNVIMASDNLYAIDNAALKIMGIEGSKVRHLPAFDDYTTVGEPLEKFIQPFRLPDPSPWNVGRLYIHFSDAICSQCDMNLQRTTLPSFGDPSSLAFLSRYIASGSFLKRIDILSGAAADVPASAKKPLCYGNCLRPLAAKHGLPIVEGCPPGVDAGRKAILDYFKRGAR